jgi:hypothetical protein
MIYELNPEKIIYPYLVKVRADSARKTIRRLTGLGPVRHYPSQNH